MRLQKLSKEYNSDVRKLYQQSNDEMGVSPTFTNSVLGGDLKDPFEFYSKDGYEMIIAIVNDVLVGMVCVAPTGEISRLSVSKNYRRQGVGRSLMHHIIEGRKIHLSCLETNNDALSFYQNLKGVHEVKRETRFSSRDNLEYTLVHFEN